MIKRMRNTLLQFCFSLLAIGSLAQPGTATVHVYRLGFTSKGGTPVYNLWRNGVLLEAKAEPGSVNTFRCEPGRQEFSAGNGRSIVLDVKADQTYFVEFQSQLRTGFRQVSKAEAAMDLGRINKFLVELVKEGDLETYVPADSTQRERPLFLQKANYYFDSELNIKIGYVRLLSDSLPVALEFYFRQPDKTFAKRVFLGDELLRFAIVGPKKNQVQEVRSEDGILLATMPLTGVNRFDVTLADGTVYDWSPLSNTSWWYTRDGVPILKASFERVDNKRTVRIVWEKEVDEPILFISCMDRGSALILEREAAARSLAGGLLLGIF